jgi:hypothetical protein
MAILINFISEMIIFVKGAAFDGASRADVLLDGLDLMLQVGD